MSILLALLYPIAVQYERDGWWLLLTPITVFTLALDVVCNYSELALLTWDFPRCKEYTFSARLLRLEYDCTWRGRYCAYVIVYLNYFAPNGKHV